MNVSTDEFLRTDYLPLEPSHVSLVKKVGGDVALTSLSKGDLLIGPNGTSTVEEIVTSTVHTYAIIPEGNFASYLVGPDQLIALVLYRSPEVRGPRLTWVDKEGIHTHRFGCTLEAVAAAKTKPPRGSPFDICASRFYEADEGFRTSFRLRYATVDYPQSEVPLLPRSVGAVASVVPEEYLKNSMSVREAFLKGVVDRSPRDQDGRPRVPRIKGMDALLRSMGIAYEPSGETYVLIGRILVPFQITYEGVGTHSRIKVREGEASYLSDDYHVRWT
jgi:hypothetical protein